MQGPNDQLTISDVFDILEKGNIFMTGGHDKEGRPIITFPDVATRDELNDEEYQKVTQYFMVVPLSDDVERGFVAIIDRRTSTWESVKLVTSKLASFFPGSLQRVFILRPATWFQRIFSSRAQQASIENEARWSTVVCSSCEELLRDIDADQITQDVGGTLVYRCVEWKLHRDEVEQFTRTARLIGSSVQEKEADLRCRPLKFYTPDDAMEEIQTHYLARQQLIDDLSSCERTGVNLVTNMKGACSSSEHLPADKVLHVVAVERIIVQLEDAHKHFNTFWSRHGRRLERAVREAEFRFNYQNLHSEVSAYSSEILEASLVTEGSCALLTDLLDKLRRISDSLDSLRHRVDMLVEEEKSMKQLDDLDDGDDQNTVPNDNSDQDQISLEDKLVGIETLMTSTEDSLLREMSRLERLYQLYEQLEHAQQWIARGRAVMERHARDPVENLTEEESQWALGEVTTVTISKADLYGLGHPKQFKETFADLLTDNLMDEVEEVLRAIENVDALCETRGTALKRYIESRRRRPSTVRQQSEDPEKSRSSSCLSEASGSSLTGSQSSVTSVEELANQRQRDHVIMEMISTERDYVNTLESIHKVFWETIDDPKNASIVPTEVLEDRTLLFGNWEDLMTFHKNVLLPAIEDCMETSSRLGCCFRENHEVFVDLYSKYCVANSAAQPLLAQVGGDDQAWIRHCRAALGHWPLPLSAHLLKPVQRVQKYQLLLGQMSKACATTTDKSALDDALATMLQVLQFVNDAMKQTDIRGYKGKLPALGRLLLNGEFQMWLDSKENRIQLRAQQRQLFLYERAILVCKRRETGDVPGVVSPPSKAVFDFKLELLTEKIGLTPSVGRDKRRFAVWTDNRAVVYMLQAPNAGVKEIWVKEVKALLLRQFEELREMAKRKRSVDILTSPALEITNDMTNALRQSPVSPAAYSSNADHLTTTSLNHVTDISSNPNSSLHKATDIDPGGCLDNGASSTVSGDEVFNDVVLP